MRSGKWVEPLIMHTHACPCTGLVLMPEEEEEKGPGFSRSHMHLIITDPVHQWQGGNECFKVIWSIIIILLA